MDSKESFSKCNLSLKNEFNRLKKLSCNQKIPQDCYNDNYLRQINYEFNSTTEHVFSDLARYLNHISTLTCFTNYHNLPGLLFFPKILNEQGCRYLFHYFIKKAPFEHYSLLKSNITLPPTDISSLRWLTFGYHHNWDTKIYSEESKDEVPSLVNRLLKCLAHLLNIDFIPEAGIINYYTCKSRIGPHVDFSERNREAPLFSLSFGSDAIFLIGKENEAPLKLVLGDGDLLVMGGSSRLAIHAVPKVYCSKECSCCSNDIMRINLNARQVNFHSKDS